MSRSSKLSLLILSVMSKCVWSHSQIIFNISQFLSMWVTNWPNIFVDQGQFSDPDFISDTHQIENVKFADKPEMSDFHTLTIHILNHLSINSIHKVSMSTQPIIPMQLLYNTFFHWLMFAVKPQLTCRS